jgi:hypothetical protein
MDEQSDNQDLTIGKDGTMDNGVNIDVKTDNSNFSEPEINEITPPNDTTDGNSTDDATAESAINFIAGNDNTDDSKVETTESVVEEAAPIDGSVSDVSDVEVKQQPEISDEPSVQSEEIQPVPISTEDSFASNQVPVAPATVSGMSNNEQLQPHEHRNNKKLAIIITLFVALFIASALVYIYTSAQNNAEESSDTSNTTVEESATPDVTPASPEDVDQVINEIDQTVEAIDETDLTEETVSEDTLGL